MKKVFLLFSIGFLMMSCSRDYYQLKTFKSETKDHETIAILPVQMVFSGVPLLDVTPEDIAALEVAESRAFQSSLFNELYRKRANTTKGPYIKMLTVDETNDKILETMSIQESWKKTPEEMAKILGVDAVVKSRIEKRRYFSDIISYGIDRLSKLLSILTKDVKPFIGGQDLKKSNDIFAEYKLIDGDSGVVLWSLSFEEPANFNNPANEVISVLNEKAAERFPYKKKR